ncbi:MAG: hypothetical protein E7235_05630 [Lachnospiraceae bacterium]|nr:hypothetical protein [Lachnospiraceae bacterium]
MAMKLKTPAARPQLDRRTTFYTSFKGVDFSVDPSLVDKNRSPYAPNLISDIGGIPEKRLGWRTIANVDSPINGMWRGELSSGEVFIVHGGNNIYKLEKDENGIFKAEVLKSGVANSRSSAFFMSAGDKMCLYILTGEEYLVYDGEEISFVKDNAYVPVVLVGRAPSGGGVTDEGVNLLSGKRTEHFLGNNKDTDFVLSADDIDSIVKIEVMNDKGDMEEAKADSYTADLDEGIVKFASPKAPILTGVDNVYITYSKTVEGYSDRIEKCSVSALYGYGGDNRVFLTGNPDYKAYDWVSGLYDPTYFPDLGYSIAGSDDTAIMGYLKLGQYLMIVKEDSSLNSTLLQRSATKDSEDNTVFVVQQGVSGLGAISKNCFVSLIDEPLFLSRQGVMGVTSSNILAERSLKNRSYYVNSRLIKEDGLENACACEWNGYYVLSVNGRAYILDGRNRTYLSGRTDGEYVFECFFWENIPARVFLEKSGELFFGTEDGRICRFNTDIETMAKFNDDGEAVCCAWATKNDDDNAPQLYKTVTRNGTGITIKPFYRSSAKIYIAKDGEAEAFIKEGFMDMFSFGDIDFSRFSFNTNDNPQDIYLKKRVKKYKRLQIIIKNDAPDEGFGIFQIAKTYYTGGFAKK